MKSESNIVYLIRNLREKFRVSVRDLTGTEVWYMYFSPLNLFFIVLGVIVLLVAIIMLIFTYTSALDLIPGYPGNRSRELLIENILRLDSMEQELVDIQVYTRNVELIMDGKTPIVRSVFDATDSLSTTQTDLVAPSTQDSILRAELEGQGIYRLNDAVESNKLRVSEDFAPPVQGRVVKRFSPRDDFFGLNISALGGKQIVAVEQGTVVLATWSPSDGSIIQIQHPNNMISVYKNAFTIVKKQGDRVIAGEVIGFFGGDSSLSLSEDATPEGAVVGGEENFLEFELWSNGNPVDPENYILF